MRRIFFISLFCACIATVANAQVRVIGISMSHVAPAGEVPSYVKEKIDLSPEVYAKLEALNREKRVDYSVLFKETFPFRKDLFVNEIEWFYKDLKEKNLEETDPIIFLASPLQMADSISWRRELQYRIDDNLQFGKQSAVVCTLPDALGKGQIMLEIWYLYDKSKKTLEVVKKQLSATGGCDIEPSGFESVYIYDPKLEPVGFLYVEYGCNYSYADKDGKKISRTLFEATKMVVNE